MEMSQHSHNSMHSDHSMDHQGDGDHYDPTDHLSVSHSMLVTPELLGLLPNSGPSGKRRMSNFHNLGNKQTQK